MEKENKVIYLHEPCKPNINVRHFYDDYQIPKQFRKNNSYVFVPCTSSVSIHYICPNCATHIQSEWEYISGVENRLTESAYSLYDYEEDDYEDSIKFKKQLEKLISKNIGEIKKEVKKIANIGNCPVCNAELIKKFPYTTCDENFNKYIDKFNSSIRWYKECEESYPSKLRGYFAIREAQAEILEKEWVNPHLDRYSDYIQMCDAIPLPKPLKAEKSIGFLKEYLLNLINLETNILCMSKRLKELYLLRGENDRDVAYEQGLPIFNFVKEIEQKNAALIDLKQEKQDFENQPPAFKTVKYPPEPIKPEMLKANFFNKKKIAALNAQAEAEYQETIKKYLVAVEKCNKRTEKNKAEAENQKKEKIEKYSEIIDKSEKDLAMAKQQLKQRRANASDYPTPAAGKKYVIDTEIASLEEALKKNFQCRNELYSYNVIFEKYRNIVAVSSFYEYLMAGRCDSLEGVTGAYNIYENERRMDAIITKLDEIETKLDEIKANQFMIYNKLNSIESSLNSLNRTMGKAVSSLESINTNTATMSKYLENISKNTDVIAHNTAVSAYYSKVNAELTNALGFMVALN